MVGQKVSDLPFLGVLLLLLRLPGRVKGEAQTLNNPADDGGADGDTLRDLGHPGERDL